MHFNPLGIPIVPPRNKTGVARCVAGLLSLVLLPGAWAGAAEEEPAPATEKSAADPATEKPNPAAPAAEKVADPSAVVSAEEIIKNFLAHLEAQQDVSPEQRAAVGKLVESTEADPFSRDIVITLAQREINTDFASALEQMSEENLEAAETGFAALSK
jgi:hypothetical protein